MNKENKELLLHKIKNSSNLDADLIPKDLLYNDEIICLSVIEKDGLYGSCIEPEEFYKNLSNDLQQNTEIVKYLFKYVDINAEDFIRWNDDLKNNKEIIAKMLSRDQTLYGLEYAGKKLLDDKEFIITAINNCDYFDHKALTDQVLLDREIALSALNKAAEEDHDAILYKMEFNEQMGIDDSLSDYLIFDSRKPLFDRINKLHDVRNDKDFMALIQ